MNQIVSRADAIKRNLERYFTGKPCCRGHVAERITRYKQCTACWTDKSTPIQLVITCAICAASFETSDTRKMYCGEDCKCAAHSKREAARLKRTFASDPEKIKAYWRECDRRRDPDKKAARQRKRYDSQRAIILAWRMQAEALNKGELNVQ